VTEIGRTLGVRHVLEGSVRRSRSRVRITAQLTDATTGGHLWVERFADRRLCGEDDVTAKIVSALLINLSARDRQRVQRQSRSIQMLLQRRELPDGQRRRLMRGRERWVSARPRLDPNFAPVHALLTNMHGLTARSAQWRSIAPIHTRIREWPRSRFGPSVTTTRCRRLTARLRSIPSMPEVPAPWHSLLRGSPGRWARFSRSRACPQSAIPRSLSRPSGAGAFSVEPLSRCGRRVEAHSSQSRQRRFALLLAAC
jgi:hypothetical protein